MKKLLARILGNGTKRKEKTKGWRQAHLLLETLEGRQLLSTIVWVNRGSATSDTDSFNARFGNNAAQARAIVDQAINAWEAVIDNFNYANVGTAGNAAVANTFSLSLSADSFDQGLRGETFINRVDAQGKPFEATIRVDNHGGGAGWFLDSTPQDNAEFKSLVTRFTANKSGTTSDFYRTVLHEMGHAMGIALDPDLALQNFLSPAGTDQLNGFSALFSFSGSTTRAVLTKDGGGHIYEGLDDPNFAGVAAGTPNDLLNPGRAVPSDVVQRRLISDLDARILRDAYGYTIQLPSTIQTFLVNMNTTTGDVTVNADPEVVNNRFTLDRQRVFVPDQINGHPIQVPLTMIVVNVNGVSTSFRADSVDRIQFLGGNGDDTFNLMGARTTDHIDVNGGDGNDTLIAPNLATLWRIMGTNNIELWDPALGATADGSLYIYADKVENLVAGSAADTFQMFRAISGKINGGGGVDVLDYTPYPGDVISENRAATVNLQTNTATNAGSIESIEGMIGSPGVDTLIGPNALNTWTMTSANAGTLTRSGSAPFTFAGIEKLVGGTSVDTLIGPDLSNTFAITAPNAGTLSNTGTLTFASMENLTGGAASDTFRFSAGQLVSGTIDGQGETDLLDYSAYTSNITVDLTSGRATGTFAVIGIENVTGGQGNDLLRGNSADNTLVGGGGSDIILGMAGNDSITGSSGRSLLLGGSGQDTLIAGGADDILIGGTTIYDLDNASLQAILKVWQQTDLSYADRINTIKFEGVGINRNIFLNSSTVSDDGAADKLVGSTGLDWFWSFGQDTTDLVTGETRN